jgi:hypothetical protein
VLERDAAKGYNAAMGLKEKQQRAVMQLQCWKDAAKGYNAATGVEREAAKINNSAKQLEREAVKG